jgi:hypothetical protein
MEIQAMASWFSTWLGLGLLGLGLWGFFTGTQDHKVMMFGVNGVLSMVHLLSGALALVGALAGNRTAKLLCLALGVIFGTLACADLLRVTMVSGQLNLNGPDNILHGVIALVCLFVGVASRSD